MEYGALHKPRVLTKAERDLLQADRPGYGTRHQVEVSFNLVNATVGAGIMGLPYAVSRAGFAVGIAASIWVALLSQLGLYMLIVAGKRARIYKFAMLVEHVMGRFGYHFLNFMILIQAGGSCVSYFILLGDTIPILLERYLPQFPILHSRALVMATIGTCCILPLNMRRSIGALARWSMLSVLCLPIIVMTILVRAPEYYRRAHTPGEWPQLDWVGSDVFGALGIMAFAFSCSQVAFNNFLTLRDQSSASWCQSTALSTSMSWTVSMVFAVIGYLCFGDGVQSNLFMNFDADDVVVNIGRFALGFSMIFSIPMGFYPTREAVQKMLGFETATRQPNQTQHYAVTVLLFGLIMIIGISVRSLGKVYALVGGFSATTLAYILPAAAYLVTRWKAPEPESPTLTTAPTLAPTLSNVIDDKAPLLRYCSTAASDVQSCSSPRLPPSTPPPNYYFDDGDASTVDGAELLPEDEDDDTQSTMNKDEPPSIRILDCMAVVLILWGFMVMFFATSGVLTEP